MSERAQHLADRSRGPGYAFPDATVVERNAGHQKPCIAQQREVGCNQLTPLLTLATLGGEMGGKFPDIFTNVTGFHHDLPCTSAKALSTTNFGTVEQPFISPWKRRTGGHDLSPSIRLRPAQPELEGARGCR
jgi:hypothetical protein